MLVVSYNSAKQSAIGTVKHFRHLRNVVVTVSSRITQCAMVCDIQSVGLRGVGLSLAETVQLMLSTVLLFSNNVMLHKAAK